MFINWLLGVINKRHFMEISEMCPIVFSIHKDEVKAFLDWMRQHNCNYADNNKNKILKNYTNEEIIKDGLLSSAFEWYGNDGSRIESNISINLVPSILGTRYTLRCKCGEEFEPTPCRTAGKKLA